MRPPPPGCSNTTSMEPSRPPPHSSTTTSAAATGRVILGKYQLGRLLGRGSFAKVYYAQRLSDRTAVAIKVIDKPKTVDPSVEPRIVREIAAMRRLSNHPNILKIHEVMATKTKIYLVMELATGGELAGKLSALRGVNYLPESTARRYFQQLVSAIHFCHHHGVTHRDIKPQNLLLDGVGTLKVSDFGLSALPDHRRDSKTILHTACGTPAYAAPEVFRRAGYDGAKADAWSCGVILFLLLAGTLPFDDSNLPAMYSKICRREFEFPPWISKRSKFIIHQLLDPNPVTRMSVETLMGHAWFKKSSSSPFHFPQFKSAQTNQCKLEKANAVNAFDIISMSSGLDLSGLFELTSSGERERRFTAKAASVEVIEERVEEVGARLGYGVEREKGRGVGLVWKGVRVLEVDILVVAPEVVMVVAKAVDGGGDGLDVEGIHGWEELKVGFEDLALSWHSDGN